MKINLAGYNLDSTTICELSQGSNLCCITPETMSAAYARISRDENSIDELRNTARNEVEAARKSNKNIIFKMGHHSVAEHAVFNFDFIDVSRLAVEHIESFRLNSYTEKSQRYIKLKDTYHIPDEIRGKNYDHDFNYIINIQNTFYQKLYEGIKNHLLKKNNDEKEKSNIEGMAKEDARYITSFATKSQLGATINARNLELMVRRFASSNLSEIREIGKILFEKTQKLAPSIIIFTEPNDYDLKTYDNLREHVGQIVNYNESKNQDNNVKLLSCSKNADNVLLASLIHRTSKISFDNAIMIANKLTHNEKLELIKKSCEFMQLYDSVLREFEHVSLLVELTVSAACFGQLKRHRMATITPQEYDPQLGLTIPQSILESGFESEFKSICEKTDEIYHKIYKDQPHIAAYVLTNAHNRRVLFKINARELYHICRLRCDHHAQWDIRDKASKMLELAKKTIPYTFLFAAGKDRYADVYMENFGKYPKVSAAKLSQ